MIGYFNITKKQLLTFARNRGIKPLGNCKVDKFNGVSPINEAKKNEIAFCRFEDENGDWIKFDENFCSNHFGTYKKCGKWALPVFPSNTSVVGSPKTPYIFDDRLDFRDLADALMQSYKMSKEEKIERGLAGREWVTSDESMASARMMNKNVIKYLNQTIDNFKPRNNFEFIKIDKLRVKQLQHKLIY